MNIEKYLKEVVQKNGTDLHLKAGSSGKIRINGELCSYGEILSSKDTREIALELMNEEQKQKFDKEFEMDISYGVPNLGRFRVNIFYQRGTVGLVLRRVKTHIESFKELNLPSILEKIALSSRGLVIVSGTTSCGKSTTVASMVNYINENLNRHIITVEDPIEFLHKDKKSIVNQREVHIDTYSYSIALRHAMRQDPDVILIGEMRDIESFNIALGASETGHIVFTTLHSTDTTAVFTRILDFFPPSQHHQIRMQLSLNLKAIICQRLIPRMDKDGLTPAVEILINTPAVSRLIRENRLNKIIAAIQGGKEDGMQTFNMSLVELCKEGFISRDQAMANATNPEALKMNLQGIFLDEDKQILGD